VWKVADIELEQQSNALLIDSDQTISYLGNRLMDDILYRFTFIEVLDRQKRYRLTKESFLRGLDSGLSYREIEQYLQENSSTAMHSLLLKQLGMLNERYQAITVYDALLLSCDERTAHVVQNLPALAEHRYKSISPTLFLMRRDTEETWRQILASAGLLIGATRSYEKIEVLKQKEPVSLSLLVQQALRCHRCTTLKVDGDKIQMITDESLQREIESSPFTQAQKQDLLHRFHAKNDSFVKPGCSPGDQYHY
jgi:hypothetical protein